MSEAATARCQLVYRAFDEGRSGAPVIALHDDGGSSIDAAPLAARTTRPLYAPQAPRPANPFQSDLRNVDAYAGFRWFLADAADRPEAASFGDSLEQLDAFLRERLRADEAATLVGIGQGGVLALSALCCGIPGIGATVCVDGFLPGLLAGKTVAVAGAKVLLVTSNRSTKAWRDATAQALAGSAADVTTSVWEDGQRNRASPFARIDLATSISGMAGAVSKSKDAADSMST